MHLDFMYLTMSLINPNESYMFFTRSVYGYNKWSLDELLQKRVLFVKEFISKKEQCQN